jgi:hypothetical protein
LIALTQHQKDLLHSKNGLRFIEFQYDLLDKNDIYKKTLNNVIYCNIDFKSLAQIKRTAQIKLVEQDNDIDYLNDRIQPFMVVKDGDKYFKWSLGVFMLNSPTRKEDNGLIYREIKCYDTSQVLVQDKVTNRYFIKKGTNYTTAILDVLLSAGIIKVNIVGTNKKLATDREFPVGTTKLKIINTLLKEINYYSIVADEQGYFVSKPYVLPSDRQPEYIYKTNQDSIIHNGSTETLDLFNVPNKFVVTLSNPEQTPLKSVYTNKSTESITSTARRGRTITDFRQVDNIADQEALDNYTKRLAENASNVYGYLDFETAIMPHHSYLDCLEVEHDFLGVKDKYIETNWSMQLHEGARMKHKIRKVVEV